MKIIVPEWAEGIEDEGVNMWIAFCTRVCDLYGYNTQYYISKDDVSKITNKTPLGLVEWLRAMPVLYDNMWIGDILDNTIVFSIEKKHLGRKPSTPTHRIRQRDRYKKLHVELKEQRSILVWAYLIGCLNHNLIGPQDYKYPQYKNSAGIKEFALDREVTGYIKQKDRPLWRRKNGIEEDE